MVSATPPRSFGPDPVDGECPGWLVLLGRTSFPPSGLGTKPCVHVTRPDTGSREWGGPWRVPPEGTGRQARGQGPRLTRQQGKGGHLKTVGTCRSRQACGVASRGPPCSAHRRKLLSPSPRRGNASRGQCWQEAAWILGLALGLRSQRRRTCVLSAETGSRGRERGGVRCLGTGPGPAWTGRSLCIR